MRLVFLLDVDNTLRDNDRVKVDLSERIRQLLGAGTASAFWSIYEAVRRDGDYVDFPRTLERFGDAFPDARAHPQVCALVLGYPFERVVFPGAIEAIEHLRELGTTAIHSDGDPVYQPATIGRAGLADAVGGPVLIYAHKEQQLADVQRRLPADHYVLIDDKPRLLVAAKAILGDRLTTVLVCQGTYANAAAHHDKGPADIEVDGIGELRTFTASRFLM